MGNLICEILQTFDELISLSFINKCNTNVEEQLLVLARFILRTPVLFFHFLHIRFLEKKKHINNPSF